MNATLTTGEARLLARAQDQAARAANLLALPVSRRHIEEARRLLNSATGAVLYVESVLAGAKQPLNERQPRE